MNNIIRIFPNKNSNTPDDEWVYIGDPPFPELLPEAYEAHVSVTFTWDIEEGLRLKRAWESYIPTKIGGPALGDSGSEFEPGMYLKRGITTTTRGCPHSCWFCYVPKREGKLQTLEIKPGHILQDNNILAAPKKHQQAVYKMLREQDRRITFSGGMDARLLRDWMVDELKDIPVDQMFFAYDELEQAYDLERARNMFSYLKRDQMRCYVLVGFWCDDPGLAQYRLEKVWDMGYLPFAMYFRDEKNKAPEGEWKKLVRQWCRPAIIKARHVGLSTETH